jgi:hypothetical protein
MFQTRGYYGAWRSFAVPALSPHFADLRVITHGAASVKAGYDPLVENPADPWERKLNYPRVWQGLYLLGVEERHTTFIGLSLILVYLVAVSVFVTRVAMAATVVTLLCVLSPPSLLCIERANIDLAIFSLCALAIVAASRTLWVSVVALFTAAVLKLYPAFGAPLLLRNDPRRSLVVIALLVSATVAYTLAIWSNISLISSATPRGTSWSYGVNVFWMRLAEIEQTCRLAPYVKFAGSLAAGGALLAPLFLLCLWRSGSDVLTGECRRCIDGLRLGAALYVGTFLLGNNWDYRLVFTLFTLPQLVAWSRRREGQIAITARIALASALYSLWSAHFSVLAEASSITGFVAFLLDEVANWLLFVALAALLFASLPLCANVTETPPLC